MLTREQVIQAVKDGKSSECMDGRDFSRLVAFFPTSDWEHFGLKLKDGVEAPELFDFTQENVLKQLERDLDFAFEKALDKRGISSSFMYAVIKMWMWVLEDDLQNFEQYEMYGLPLFKAVALKYGFKNEIGDDDGDEDKYDEEGVDFY